MHGSYLSCSRAHTGHCRKAYLDVELSPYPPRYCRQLALSAVQVSHFKDEGLCQGGWGLGGGLEEEKAGETRTEYTRLLESTPPCSFLRKCFYKWRERAKVHRAGSGLLCQLLFVLSSSHRYTFFFLDVPAPGRSASRDGSCHKRIADTGT